MAVQATHLNPFSPQVIQNRDLLNPPNQGNTHFQFLGNYSLPENQPFYAPAVKTDGGFSVSRKRSRDEFCATPNFTALQKQNSECFAGEEILPQLQQHQMEMDAIISQHMKKIRLELEERQRQQAKLLASAMGEGVLKMLKGKEDQIQGMKKLNLVLQERVRSLYMENQLLRDVARMNEATANSLRTNLEQVLLQVAGEEQVWECEEEVASCCDEGGQRCRKCGERESSVLVLPCRHLCLCNVCGSGSQQVEVCPVCDSTTNATLHVNLSS